jgi:hypothetical protein
MTQGGRDQERFQDIDIVMQLPDGAYGSGERK